MHLNKPYVIAIDAGGTACKVGLYDNEGREIDSDVTGPGNLFSNFDVAFNNIMLAINTMAERHRLEPKEFCVSIGAAGAGIPSVQKQFKQNFPSHIDYALNTDLYIATFACNNMKDCILINLGTGSSIGLLINGQFKSLGGNGLLFGDIGSGAWFGQNIIAWYLDQLDLLHVANSNISDESLFSTCCQILGSDKSVIIESYTWNNLDKLAGLTKQVFEKCTQSSHLDSLIKQAGEYYSNILSSLDDSLAVFVCGGLSDRVFAPLAIAKNKQFLSPKSSAKKGAFWALTLQKN